MSASVRFCLSVILAALAAGCARERLCDWECVEAGELRARADGQILLDGYVRWDGETLTVTDALGRGRVQLAPRAPRPETIACLESVDGALGTVVSEMRGSEFRPFASFIAADGRGCNFLIGEPD